MHHEISAAEHGLTPEEYGWILERLGRTPTITDVYVYSNLNEHFLEGFDTHPPQVTKVSLFQWIPSLSYQLEF